MVDREVSDQNFPLLLSGTQGDKNNDQEQQICCRVLGLAKGFWEQGAWEAFLGSGSTAVYPDTLTEVVGTLGSVAVLRLGHASTAGEGIQGGCAVCACVLCGSPLAGGAQGVSQVHPCCHKMPVRLGAGSAWRANHCTWSLHLLLCFELTLLEISGFAPKLSVQNRHQPQDLCVWIDQFWFVSF